MKPAKNAACVCIVLPISLKTIILYRFLLGRKSETYIIQKCAWYWKQLDRMGGRRIMMRSTSWPPIFLLMPKVFLNSDSVCRVNSMTAS